MKKLFYLTLFMSIFAGNVICVQQIKKLPREVKQSPATIGLIQKSMQYMARFTHDHPRIAFISGVGFSVVAILAISQLWRNRLRSVLSFQNEALEEKRRCGKCSQLRKISEFLLYCKNCRVTICKGCDLNLAFNGKLFLDKRADFFFVKSNCFNCKDEVRSYGTYLNKNTIRGTILMDRAHEDHEPFESVYIGLNGNYTY